MRISIYAVVCALLVSSANAEMILTLVVDDSRATQPAINDSGEVVYGKDGAVFSTVRDLLISSGVDMSNLGLANDGEVVYGTSPFQIFSTTRGLLVTDPGSGVLRTPFGPTISPTTGEVSYTTSEAVATTLQGAVATETPGFNFSVSDVNDHGEVVYEYRDLSLPYSQIASTTRGLLTPAFTEGHREIFKAAIEPAINNLGEVVWAGHDEEGRQQIFSSKRGQLTFFGGSHSFLNADLPDINSQGVVVFRGVTETGERGLFTLSDSAVIPEPSSLTAWASLGLMGLAIGYWRKRKIPRPHPVGAEQSRQPRQTSFDAGASPHVMLVNGGRASAGGKCGGTIGGWASSKDGS